MSRVQKPPTLSVAAPAELAPSDSSEIPQSKSLTQEYARQVVVSAKLTSTQLNMGATVPLSKNLVSVFKQGVEGVPSATSKCIITEVSLQNCWHDVDARVAVAANLFSSKTQSNSVSNTSGWLYTEETSDCASKEHVAEVEEGFTNLVSLLPFEQTRHNPPHVLYQPTNSALSERHLAEYGNFSTKDQLWDGIKDITSTSYYVPASSIVTKVIDRNWDKLAIDSRQEELLEGEYYKFSKPVVEQCIDQLYENVIQRLPFSDLSKMKVHFRSNIEPSSEVHNITLQLKFKYQWPSSA